MVVTASVNKAKQVLRSLGETAEDALSPAHILPVTLQDVCAQCPLSEVDGSGIEHDPETHSRIQNCRRQYFQALLQAYVGAPGGEELGRPYEYQRTCELCYMQRYRPQIDPDSDLMRHDGPAVCCEAGAGGCAYRDPAQG